MINLFNIKAKRKHAYQSCLTDPMGNLTLAGQQVIKDLMKFCNVNSATIFVGHDGKIDPLRMAFEEGRRSVFNRIKYYTTLTDAELRKAKTLTED